MAPETLHAVLLDRDGTLVVDVPYNGDPAEVVLMPGARDALARLRELGIPTALVSNQSGIARGLLDRAGGVFQDSPTSERELLVLAERKLLEAARADPTLLDTAQRNTRETLTGLLRGLGFERVTIRFAAPPPV